jgi:hypothetical protein
MCHILQLINAIIVDHHALFFPDQPAGRAYPEERGLVVLFCRVLLSDVFSVVNEIIIKLTRDVDLVGINTHPPKLFQ